MLQPQFGLFAAAASLVAGYVLSYPWSGPMVALDNATNFRIPAPVQDEACNLASQPNTSLQLAYVDGGVAFLLTAFCLVYLLAPKKGTLWPLEILWASSLLVFVLEMVVFAVVSARVGVWFLSCNNAGKLEGACPAARYRQLRGDITDAEQCYFAADTLTVYNAENDAFSSCQEASQLSDYNRRFARWDVPSYYSAGALCLRGEASTNLAWCYYYGCDPVCNRETYAINLRWIVLDTLLLLCVLATHLITFGNLYVIKGSIKDE